VVLTVMQVCVLSFKRSLCSLVHLSCKLTYIIQSHKLLMD